jgi:hypothetical protein
MAVPQQQQMGEQFYVFIWKLERMHLSVHPGLWRAGLWRPVCGGRFVACLFVAGRFVAGQFVAGRFVAGRFVAGRLMGGLFEFKFYYYYFTNFIVYLGNWGCNCKIVKL